MEESDDIKRIKYILGSFQFLYQWKGAKTKVDIRNNQMLLDALVNRMRMVRYGILLLSKSIKYKYKETIDFDYIVNFYDESFLVRYTNIIETIFPINIGHTYFFQFNGFEYILKRETGFVNFQNKNELKNFISESQSNEVGSRSIRTVKKS